MNYFSWPLAVFAIVIFCLVVLVAKLLSKNKPFRASVNATTIVIAAVATVVFYSAYYVFYILSKINSGDSFSTDPFCRDSYVIVRKTELYQALSAAPYLDTTRANAHLEPGDTVTTVATYQQGTVISGTSYGKIMHQGKPYWFAEADAITLFAHTYANQPLVFTVPEHQNAAHWERAKRYMEKYRLHHGNDITLTTLNDTVLHTRCDYNYGADWFLVSRRRAAAGWEFKVDGGTRKNRESCIIAGVKDRFGNTPANQNAAAYFIVHATFFKDPVQK